MMRKRFLQVLLVLLFITACGDEKMGDVGNKQKENKDMISEKFRKVENVNIFFGHQSVGANVLDGIRIMMEKHPDFKPNIVELRANDVFPDGPSFAHSFVGRNGDPLSKIKEFSKHVDVYHKSIHIAFVKLCYVDFKYDSNLELLFDEYKASMDRLKSKYPSIKIIHFTVPLTTSKPSMYTWIRKFAGRKDVSVLSNVQRNRYNDMLRKEYAGKELFFDLAEMESTLDNDGSRSFFRENGETFYVLAKEYSDDGGHLNTIGKQRIGRNLVEYISEIQ